MCRTRYALYSACMPYNTAYNNFLNASQAGYYIGIRRYCMRALKHVYTAESPLNHASCIRLFFLNFIAHAIPGINVGHPRIGDGATREDLPQ